MINDEFITEIELIKAGVEFYFEEDLIKFENDLKKAFDNGDIGESDIEKARRDTSKLAMRMITDKNGNRRKVWVKVTQDAKTGKQKETDFNSGDTVTAKHKDGSMQSGKLVSISQNTKTDATGIAQIKFGDGSVVWRSLNAIKHGGNSDSKDSGKGTKKKKMGGNSQAEHEERLVRKYMKEGLSEKEAERKMLIAIGEVVPDEKKESKKLKTGKGGANPGRTKDGNEYNEDGKPVKSKKKSKKNKSSNSKESKGKYDSKVYKDIQGVAGDNYTPAMIDSIIEQLEDAGINEKDLKSYRGSTREKHYSNIDKKVNELKRDLMDGMEHKNLDKNGVKDILIGIVQAKTDYGTQIFKKKK